MYPKGSLARIYECICIFLYMFVCLCVRALSPLGSGVAVDCWLATNTLVSPMWFPLLLLKEMRQTVASVYRHVGLVREPYTDRWSLRTLVPHWS